MKPSVAEMSTEEARQVLVTIQGLWQQSFPNVEAIIARTHVVQIDSISIIARNHDLAFWTRKEEFQPEHLADALYKSRTLLEQHYPVLIVDTREYPYWHQIMAARPKTESPERLALAPLMERARLLINEQGQVSSQDLPSGKQVPGGFTTISAANKALETMWYDGELLIASRHPNRGRIFSTPELLLPADLLDCSPSSEEIRRFCAEKALRVLGLATLQSWSHLMNIYAGLWKTVASSERRTLLLELIEEGVGIPIEVNGGGSKHSTYFMHADYLDYLSQKIMPPDHVQLVPPLDMLLLDRDRLETLFGFHHRFEAYTQKAKRTYGYYCMPILYGSRLVGRIDAAKNGNALQINLLQIEEPSLSRDDLFLRELQQALTNLMLFVNCSEIVSNGTS